MACNCIDVINEKMIVHNTRILEPMLLADRSTGKQDTARRVFIETEQIAHGRGKLKARSIFSTFCPFCGVRHEPMAEEHDKQMLDAAQAAG